MAVMRPVMRPTGTPSLMVVGTFVLGPWLGAGCLDAVPAASGEVAVPVTVNPAEVGAPVTVGPSGVVSGRPCVDLMPAEVVLEPDGAAEITLSACTTAPLLVRTIAVEPPDAAFEFSLGEAGPAPLVLAGGESVRIEVRYTGKRAVAEARVVVESNAGPGTYAAIVRFAERQVSRR